MRRKLIVLFLILQQIISIAQTTNELASDTKVYVVVEENAKFPGGNEAMKNYITEHLRYPADAVEAKIEGSVYVTFVVEKDGSLTNFKILRTISGCKSCTEEALKIVRSMPKWIPGRHKGVEKRTQCIVPVKFSVSAQTDEVKVQALLDSATNADSTTNSDSAANLVYVIVEQAPTFPGGEKKMTAYINKTMNYPPTAYKEGRAGVSYVNFIVEKDGSISGVRILKGASGGADLDEEAMRIVKSMPKWNAAKQNGRIVKAYFNLPIRFLR